MEQDRTASAASRGRLTDMTSGAPAALILRFGLPLIAANTLQQLYSMVDAIILGRFGGVTGLAVLGTCSWPVWLLVSVLTNFSLASSIVLAKRFGAKDAAALRRAVGNIYTAAGALCAVLTAVLLAAARPMLLWQQTPAELLAPALSYLRITFGGLFALLAYNLYAAFLRAAGDSKTPLLAIAAATAVNIALDLWFVAGLGWGAPGAALATVAAQAASAAVCMARVHACEPLRVQRCHFRVERAILHEHVMLSAPMLLQSCVIALGGFFVQTHINAYGAVFTAGMSATSKVFGLLETASIALAQATATFVGQNWGARRFDRIRQGVRGSVLLSLGIAALLSLSMLLWGRALLALFVDAQALDSAQGLLLAMSAGLWLMNPMYVLRQSLQALGNAMVPLAASFLQLAARVLVTLYLPLALGQAGLYFPNLAAWGVSLALIGCVYPGWVRRCEERERLFG